MLSNTTRWPFLTQFCFFTIHVVQVAKEKGFGKKHEERKNKKFRGNDGSRPRGNFRGARGAPGFVP